MKKEMSFKEIENQAVDFCTKNNITHEDYIKNFVNILLQQYYVDREVYLFEKEVYKLNSHNRNSYEAAHHNFHNSELDLFEWLDKVEDFTFFILNPVYQYAPRKAEDKKFNHQKIEWTGMQNIDILQDYINYKFK